MSIEDFVSQPGRERLRRLHPLYIDNSTWFEESGNGISKSMLRMMYGLLKEPYPRYMSMPKDEYILSQPPLDDDGQPPKVPLELMNQIVLEETPKTKGRIFGLGKLGKRTRSHPTSSYMYNRDPELERALQEKDDRIEALEKLMEEKEQADKKRDEEIAKKDAEMAKFMQDVLSRLPPNSSS
ncbi:unnamed protein product [Arabidopsis lyrata]|nr:unnamed protein product [Arabidopsis lyrata]